MKTLFQSIFSLFWVLLLFSLQISEIGYAQAQEKTKLFRVNNDSLLFQSTGPIYKDSMETETGASKKATEGNTFASVVIYFYNSKADQSGTSKPIELKPENVLLLNEKKENEARKIYSGMNATKYMPKRFKPFTEAITLKPGEEKMVTMSFHIPKKAKIVGIMYKLDKMNPLLIDFREE